MEKISKEEVSEILNKYQKKLGENVQLDELEHFPGDNFSREYKLFRKQTLEKKISRYEALCNFAEKIIKLSPEERNINRVKVFKRGKDNDDTMIG